MLNLQTAFDTLGSQAFGAQNYPRVGVLLQRTLFIMFCACVPVSRLFLWAARCLHDYFAVEQIAVLWWYTEPLLLKLRQPPEVAHYASQYAKRLISSLPCFAAFEAVRRFCQVQGVVKPMLVVAVIVDVLHPLWCWLYIYKLELGFAGAAWATVTSHIVNFLFMMTYLMVIRPHKPETWPGWTTQAFQGLGEYMKLAIPGGMPLLFVMRFAASCCYACLCDKSCG